MEDIPNKYLNIEQFKVLYPKYEWVLNKGVTFLYLDIIYTII